MAKKTISDPLDAIINLRATLSTLNVLATDLERTVARVPRPELTAYKDGLNAAREMYNLTAEFAEPQFDEKVLSPEEIGKALYTWFYTHASFAEQLHPKVFENRLQAFLQSQQSRFPVKQRGAISTAFWKCDEERFDNDVAMNHETKTLKEKLEESYPHAKPNSDCSLELWALSALMNREAVIDELQVERDTALNIEGLLSATDEDHGAVTLEFTSEEAASEFMRRYQPTVDFDELPKAEQALVLLNRQERDRLDDNTDATDKQDPVFRHHNPYVSKVAEKLYNRIQGELGCISAQVLTIHVAAAMGQHAPWQLRGSGELLKMLQEHYPRLDSDPGNAQQWALNALKAARECKPQWRYARGSVMTATVTRTKSTRFVIQRRMLEDTGNLVYFGRATRRSDNHEIDAWFDERTLNDLYECVAKQPVDGKWAYDKNDTFVPHPDSAVDCARQLNIWQRVLNEQGEPCYLVVDPFSQYAPQIMPETRLNEDYRPGSWDKQ